MSRIKTVISLYGTIIPGEYKYINKCIFVCLQLKQMRKEVDLTRKRSLKLKAQVDKLQGQSHDGLVWSQHRERVREMLLTG